jgi:hypothetical protein
MQAFIAWFSARQANETLNVRPRAQEANAILIPFSNSFCGSFNGEMGAIGRENEGIMPLSRQLISLHKKRAK